MAGPLTFSVASVISETSGFSTTLSSSLVGGSGIVPTTVSALPIDIMITGGVAPYIVSVTAVGSADSVNVNIVQVNATTYRCTFNRFFSSEGTSSTTWSVVVEDSTEAETSPKTVSVNLTGISIS